MLNADLGKDLELDLGIVYLPLEPLEFLTVTL
jgi:hypothetical protein